MLRRLLFGIAALAGFGFASSAQAVVFTLDDFTGDDASATIEVTQSGDDLLFDVQVDSPDFADIRGVFFNVADNSLLAGLSATGADVTDSGDPGSLSGDTNMNPLTFEFGVEIGTEGMGTDDIMATVFTISHSTESLALATFFETGEDVIGLRLTSVGDSAQNRGGSSKLSGGFPDGPPTEAPEPGTLLLFGAGLVALGLVRRIRSA